MRFLIIALLLIGCSGGGSSDPVASEPQTVVCFGTSLTDMGYAPMLQAHEAELNISVINMGFRGFNCWMLYLKHFQEVMALSPDIVIFESAINDAYAKTGFDWMEMVIGNMIQHFHSIGARVIILTTNPSTVDRPALAAYYEEIKAIAWKYEAEIIDLYPLWTPEDMKYIPDGVHPTMEGLEEVTYSTIAGML